MAEPRRLEAAQACADAGSKRHRLVAAAQLVPTQV